MKILAVVPDDIQALHMTKVLNGADWSGVLVRVTALPYFGGEIRAFLNCDDRGRSPRSLAPTCPYPDNPFVQYEATVDRTRSLFNRAPVFNWGDIERGIELLQHVLNTTDADVLVTWNERLWYNEVATAWALTNNVPCVKLERGCFPETYIVDDLGFDYGRNRFNDIFMGYVLTNSDIELFERKIDRVKTLEIQNEDGPSAPELSELAEPGKPIVFLPLQVPIDTNVVFRHGGNKELISFASKSTEVSVFAKLHPADRWTNQYLLREYCDERGVQLFDASLFSYIDASSAVVTMNSQAGIDALLRGKNVGVLGDAFWKYTGATVDDPESVMDVVNAEIDKEVIDRFLVSMRLHYLREENQVLSRIEELVGQ